MSDSDERVDGIESGGSTTNQELVQLKKEMIQRVFDKVKEKNKDDVFLSIGRKLVEDYLLDEGISDDKIGDFFIGMGLTFLSTSKNQLKDFREKIKNTNTKEELDALEKSIIDSLDNPSTTQQQSRGRTVSSTVPLLSGAAAADAVTRRRRSRSSRTSTGSSSSSSSRGGRRRTSTETDDNSVVESAQVGEAKEVPLKERMGRLFPDGTPTKESDMRKYLTKITVPVMTSDGKTKNLKLHIHKKLANEYSAIFQEMYDKRIPVNPEKTGGFNRRLVRGGTKQSHHSYGSAVDVNWDVNGGVYGRTDENSSYFNSQDTVAIWKNHGFYRGGDWSKRSYDPMHFTYMNA